MTAGSLEQLAVGRHVEFDKRKDHRDKGKLRAVNVRLVEEEKE